MVAPSSCTEPGPFPSVLVVSSTYPRWPGDATPRFVHDLAMLATQAWNVDVLAPHHPGAALRETIATPRGHGRLEVRRFPYFVPRGAQRLCYGGGILPNARASWVARAQLPFLVGAELVAARRAVRERRRDLVHAHFLVPQGAVAMLLGRGPLVVSVHGSDLFALRGAPFDALFRRIAARSAIVTVNGRVAEQEVLRRLPSIAPKLRVLPMGIDTERFRATAEEREPAVITFVGRLARQKGAHVLLDAFDRLGRRARLVVAGDGPEGPRLRARARGDVELAGPLAPDAVARLLRRATMLVVPSLEGRSGSEAQGLVAIEAMAARCPLVVSRSGGLPELVGGDAPSERGLTVGPRGIAVAPADPEGLAEAIRRVLDDPEGARERALAAERWAVERYSLPRIGERLLAIYEEARRC